MNAALPTVFTSVPLIVPTSNSGGSSVRLGSGAPFRVSGRLASADLPSSAKSAWHRVQTARDNPQICCIMQQRPSRSPNASWHHLQQGTVSFSWSCLGTLLAGRFAIRVACALARCNHSSRACSLDSSRMRVICSKSSRLRWTNLVVRRLTMRPSPKKPHRKTAPRSRGLQ
jgi:hypothetical protein